MRRRAVLASTIAGFASVAGCLGGEESSPDPSNDDNDDERSGIEPDGSCGVVTQSLSSQLVSEGGTDACFDGAEPSLAVENERDEPVEATVEITAGESDDPLFSKRFDLDPDERLVERSALPADGDRVATVTVAGETASGSWERTSCYRHGIAITREEIEFGLVPPMAGPGDTQHDCYAGDDADIRIYNGETAQTVSLHVVDHCAETTATETFEMEADGVERARGTIANGGIYDVTVSVEDGGEETYEFENDCWGLSASVDGDGEVVIHQVAID